jgi:Ribbon-helix-helix protein, copG family
MIVTSIRLTPEDADEVEAAARAALISMGEFLRRAVREKLERDKCSPGGG